MLNAKYTDLVENLKKETAKKFETMPALDSVEYLNYLKVKANLEHFTQESVSKDPYDFYQKVWFNQELTEEDQKRQDPLEGVEIKGYLPSTQPCIYCSFHLGTYRLINYLLLDNNINFSLLLSKHNEDYNGLLYSQLSSRFNQRKQKTGSLEIICAEDEKVGFQLIRNLKKDKSLLVYLDGNSGVGGIDRNDEKLVLIDFLGQKIFVRKGIAFISHFLNIPIVPIISYRSEAAVRTIEILPPVFPDKGLDRDEYAQDTTQQLFNVFSNYLMKYPDQWGGWFYFNHFINKNTSDTKLANIIYQPDVNYTFNQNRYRLFIQEMLHYLFDVKTHDCIAIPKALWKLLLKVERGEVDYSFLPNLLKESLFNQLLRSGILVPRPIEA